MTAKRSKHPRYDDPSAFYARWPAIREIERSTALSLLQPTEKMYQMGKVKVSIVAPNDKLPGYFMTIRCNNRYPTWDEVVWIRYNLIPDAAIMTMLLPNLNNYINQENTTHRYVFTFEQKGWALDPPPRHCDQQMIVKESWTTDGLNAHFHCAVCGTVVVIDMSIWNEQHENGLNGSENHDHQRF